MVEVIMTKPTSTKTSTTTKTTTTTTTASPPWAVGATKLSKKSTVTTAKGNGYLSSFSAINILS